MESSRIEWCDDTFNGWIGCQKVSRACKHCYAEVSAPARVSRAKGLELWGPPATSTRQRTSADYWREPLRWNRLAADAGRPRLVFAQSLADTFEDHPDVVAWRAELLELAERTEHLVWLMLTKRTKNVRAMVPRAWLAPGAWPRNVVVGATVEDQATADVRIPELVAIPGHHFLSMEPLAECVDLAPWLPSPALRAERDAAHARCDAAYWRFTRERNAPPPSVAAREAYVRRAELDAVLRGSLSWVIVGGESGPQAELFDVTCARDAVAQCLAAGVAPFVKQMGARPDVTDDVGPWTRTRVEKGRRFACLNSHKGDDPHEWPEALRVRRFPAWSGR